MTSCSSELYQKLLGRVPVLPQNPAIAIDIASTSCSRTATTAFAGELVELESLLVQKRRWRSMVLLLVDLFGKVKAGPPPP